MNPVRVILFLLLILLFSSFVNANTYLNQNSTWDINLTGAFWASIALGDVDNDGKLDIAQIGCTGTTGGTTCNNYISKIYINNDTGFVGNSTWEQSLTAVNYGSIAFGDIDNDGDLDLALTGCNNGGGRIADCNGRNSFIYTNNGTSFVENSTLKGDITNVWKGSITFGDLDLDGKLDLVLTGQSTTAKIAKIYINNGTGFAENSTWQSGLTGIFESGIVLGDIYNDGRLDLISAGSAGTDVLTAKVYINNGSSLVENSIWQQNLLGVERAAVSLGDFNNNGRMDLTLIGHTSSDNHRIYNNTGTTFSQIQSESNDLIGLFEGSQAFGDYDNDGDLDLFTAGEEQYSTLYIFDGLQFTSYLSDPESGVFNTEYGPSAAWGDLNKDGDLDLVLIGYDHGILSSNAAVYINNISTPNIKPAPPTNFTASYQNGKLTLTWTNASDTETPTLGLYYNIKVGTSSNKNSIVSGIYGGGDDNGYFGNMMQRKSITLNTALSPNQTIYYSVQTIDTALANGSWSIEQNFTVPQDTTTPTITLNAPGNGFNTSNFVILFNATVSDDINLTNVTLYGNWTGTFIVNETNSSGINNTNYFFSKNLTVFGDGEYSWLIQARDNSNNTINSSTRIFRIDTIAPQISLSSPSNASTQTSSSTVTFTYNVTDAAVANCSLIVNNTIDQTDTSITANIAQTFSKTLDNRLYNWSVNCTDFVGLQNSSATYFISVSYTAPTGGSNSAAGGGGGGGGSVSFAKEVSRITADAGQTKTLSYSKDVSVTEIAITPAEKLSNVAVTVERTSLADSSVRAAGNPAAEVYRYLRITTAAKIDKAEIKFKVPISWLENYDENKVTLKHYTDVWQSLPTRKVSKDTDNVFYRAETSGFSLFAITAEKKAEEIVGENVTAETATENVTEEVTEIVEEEVLPKKDWFNLYLIAILIAGIGYVVYYELKGKGKKRKC